MASRKAIKEIEHELDLAEMAVLSVAEKMYWGDADKPQLMEAVSRLRQLRSEWRVASR